ncbi:hypothetical protein PENSPDRAFT_653432 [Peniophora sp. CONT]|nr:hypothetical protein PENSPDRAFT_653432 [Peniophora sp. CONT]
MGTWQDVATDVVVRSPKTSCSLPSSVASCFRRNSQLAHCCPVATTCGHLDLSIWHMALPLPPEIFCSIFRILAIEQPPRTRSLFKGKCTHGTTPLSNPAGCTQCHTRNLGWLNLTHVCRLWREIAYATSGLWTSIDYFALSHPFVELFLKNSQNQILSLSAANLNALIRGQFAMYAFVLERAHARVGTLEVEHGTLVEIASVFRERPLSNLKHLSVFDAIDSANIPDPFAIIGPAALHELHISSYLDGATLSQNTFLHNLRRLSVDFRGKDSSMSMEALRPLKQLVILRLRNFGEAEWIHEGDVIELAYCREIDLQRGRDATITSILRALRLPSNVRFLLGVQLDYDSLSSPLCVAALRHHYDRVGYCLHNESLRASFYHHAKTNRIIPGSFDLEWRIGAFSCTERTSSPELAVTFNCTTTVESQARNCLANEHTGLFGLASLMGTGIHELDLLPPDRDNLINLRGIMGRQFSDWTSVERARAAGIDLIAATLEELVPRSERALLYPHLTELILTDFPMWMLANNLNDFRTRLVTLLRSRLDLGAPIRTVQLANADGMKKTVLWADLSDLAHVCNATPSDLGSRLIEAPKPQPGPELAWLQTDDWDDGFHS